MPNFPGSEQWMIGPGYDLLVIWSIGGPNLNELSAPIHNSRPDPMPTNPVRYANQDERVAIPQHWACGRSALNRA